MLPEFVNTSILPIARESISYTLATQMVNDE
jgi:hypothetical protein